MIGSLCARNTIYNNIIRAMRGSLCVIIFRFYFSEPANNNFWLIPPMSYLSKSVLYFYIGFL